MDLVPEVFDRPELRDGLGFGLVTLGAGVLLGGAWRMAASPASVASTEWKGPRIAPVAGLLLTAAGLLALDRSQGLPDDLVVPLVALAAAGLLAGLVRLPAPAPAGVGLLLSLPGAYLLATWGDGWSHAWVEVLLVVGVPLGGTLVADFDDRWRRHAMGPLLLAISVAGVYGTVPDTERALVLLGAALPLALLSVPFPLASLGRAGAYAATGLLFWTIAVEGRGRAGSIVGAVGCLGLFVIEPLARVLAGGRSPLRALEALRPGLRATVPVAGVHLALVYVGSRIAGLRSDAASAVVIVALVGVVTLLLGLLVARRSEGRAAPEAPVPADVAPVGERAT